MMKIVCDPSQLKIIKNPINLQSANFFQADDLTQRNLHVHKPSTTHNFKKGYINV